MENIPEFPEGPDPTDPQLANQRTFRFLEEATEPTIAAAAIKATEELAKDPT